VAGFDGIEIFDQDLIVSDSPPPSEVGQMVCDQLLTITLFQPFRDFEGLPEPQRSRAFARAARKFDRVAQDFRDPGNLTARHGVRVGFEALALGPPL
jgi:4-hydroxyphenylpyruvate dioxygenase